MLKYNEDDSIVELLCSLFLGKSVTSGERINLLLNFRLQEIQSNTLMTKLYTNKRRWTNTVIVELFDLFGLPINKNEERKDLCEKFASYFRTSENNNDDYNENTIFVKSDVKSEDVIVITLTPTSTSTTTPTTTNTTTTTKIPKQGLLKTEKNEPITNSKSNPQQLNENITLKTKKLHKKRKKSQKKYKQGEEKGEEADLDDEEDSDDISDNDDNEFITFSKKSNDVSQTNKVTSTTTTTTPTSSSSSTTILTPKTPVSNSIHTTTIPTTTTTTIPSNQSKRHYLQTLEEDVCYYFIILF